MSTTFGFLLFLSLTVALLGGVLFTGLKAKRRAHLPLVALLVSSLATTVFFAERLGMEYDLDSAGFITGVHLFFAKLTALAYLLPLGTGLATLRRIERLRFHRFSAFFAATLTVLSLVTGTWMILCATPLEIETSTLGVEQIQDHPGQEQQAGVGEDRDQNEQEPGALPAQGKDRDP